MWKYCDAGTNNEAPVRPLRYNITGKQRNGFIAHFLMGSGKALLYTLLEKKRDKIRVKKNK